MSLPKQRKGESFGFHLFSVDSYEGTLGDPEKIIWSSIKHMISLDVASRVLCFYHNITNQRLRKKVAANMKLYIQHAFEFYEAAHDAKANTAPLFYYYSFLNLAKALCEIRYPKFHTKPESYRHGLSWRPNTKYLVNMEVESVSVSTRGVWHALWEAIEGERCTVANPAKLSVRELFGLCFGTSIEFTRAYNRLISLVDLVDPDILIDEPETQIWLRFSVNRYELRQLRISRHKLLNLITYKTSNYKQVQSSDKDLWTFELEHTKQIPRKYKEPLFNIVQPEIQKLNLFTRLDFEELTYAIPIQTRLPITLSQLMVLYTLTFWLGSLVRYDPHSLSELQDSEYWLLIDGFMNQCRIWLLELFEWQFYKAETTLRLVR